ncbi:putative hydrolase of the alpha/beta-hydrolase fold protein [Devosia sp. LC5]|uniref:alpha/beta hydrolase family protein n=1 Tax=Devosia sp. LC5 TaxID=1502724 RepID=UPI0004E2E985|nr:alpha/beta hydrolase [Devosia sp. LC5]KFC72559.1 putative hydrolase of the alpha/beta-hydrolase fold protein [Devosia sp. LC5]
MWKISGYAIVGLIALLAIYVVIGGLVFNQMLNRILVVGSGTDLAAAGQPASSPYDLAYRGDPKVAFGFDFQSVSIATDGGGAPAWVVPPPGPPQDVWAIFVHGIAGAREGGYRYLPALRAAGFTTLLITYRNDKEAPKSADGIYSFGLTEWPDLDAAVAYALEHGAAEVIIAADSMGGGVLGQFLKHSQHTNRVQALLMDAPALDFPAVARAIAASFRLPLASVLAGTAERMFSLQHGLNLAEAVSVPEVAAFSGPIMLVHGEGDRIVPIGISKHLLATRFGDTVFLRTHADHLLSRAEDPERYDRLLRAFLDALQRTEKRGAAAPL